MKTLNLFDNFLWAEEENTRRTLRQFGKDLELYKHSFNLLCETFVHLHKLMEKDPRKIPTPKKVVLIIVNRIIQLISSIRVLNLKGYYYDVKVLERCLFESMGLCAYLGSNLEEVDNWMEGKVEMAKIKLVDCISSLLDIKERRGIPFYGKLSGYVHTDASSVVSSLIVDIDREAYAMSFQLTPIFDEEKACEISWYPMLMLLILRKIFGDELSKKRKGEIVKFCKQYVAQEGYSPT